MQWICDQNRKFEQTTNISRPNSRLKSTKRHQLVFFRSSREIGKARINDLEVKNAENLSLQKCTGITRKVKGNQTWTVPNAKITLCKLSEESDQKYRWESRSRSNIKGCKFDIIHSWPRQQSNGLPRFFRHPWLRNPRYSLK